MANNTPPSPSSSRLIRFITFAASLGVVVVIYLLRRKPAQQAVETPPSIISAEATAKPAPIPIKKWQEFAVLGLTFLYGFLLIILQNIDPRLSFGLIVVTVVTAAGVAISKHYLNPAHASHIVFDVITLPIRFYGTGQPGTRPAEKGTAASFIVSGIFLCGIVVSLLLLPLIPVVALLIIIVLIVMATYAWLRLLDVFIIERRFLAAIRTTTAPDEAALPRVSRRLVLAELLIIALTTYLITRPFYETPPNWQLSGSEVEWLTSTIHAAHTGLQEYGRIPRWQPYIAHGEPILENPFNFIFNPFAGMPSLVLGPVMGLRVSVIINYFLAGLGGWFLGRVLGFASLARILLALLLMGKGNIHTMLNSSYYQLAFSQIYMPWVIGGVITVVRFPKQRWPIVLTALAMTLQLFDGNLWYVLPTAVGAVCTAGVCMVGADKGWIKGHTMRRFILTGVMTIGLSAVIALPVVLQFNRVGKHADEAGAGWVAPLSDVLPLYFDSNRERIVTYFEPGFGRTLDHYVRDVDEFYYSFVIPGWYVLLILIALPLYRPVSRRERLIAFVAVVLFGLATLWGAGGKQPILWLYETIAPLRQWRFVPRALAVASFWLALWVAMRTNHLWKNIHAADWASLLRVKSPTRFSRLIPVVLGIIMVVATGFAAIEVNDQWYQYPNILRQIDFHPNQCMTWLRQQYPNEQLDVWQQNYIDITTFLNNRVRTSNISADFEMLPQIPTVGQDWLDLNGVLPRFALLAGDDQRAFGREVGYQWIKDSPNAADGLPCVYRLNGRTLPYAYSISVTDLDAMEPPDYAVHTDLSAFSPIPLVERRDDQIALVVTDKRTEPIVVGVQESSYPGWRVEVDGQAAKIESVGRQIGVVIPAGEKPVQIYFVYDPKQPIIGGLITLLTAVLCTLYLVTFRPAAEAAIGLDF